MVTSMRLREAIHSHYGLSFIGIFAAYAGADFLILRHPVPGMVLTLVGAFWSAAWAMTLPGIHFRGIDVTALIRFWLLVLICAGTSAFLVQKDYDEQSYQLSLPSVLPDSPDNKAAKSWCPAPFRCE
jgi:hypothetical protein